MRAQLLLMAKAPVPGLVKTRLCPPCTPIQAAAVAAAALADTLDAGTAAGYIQRTIVLNGQYQPPAGWAVVAQRGAGLAERLAHGFADTTMPGVASVLVGMDTPQLSADLLDRVSDQLRTADAVLGPATDGGWWVLGLRDPRHAAVLGAVVMSTPDTAVDTLAALRRVGVQVALAPVLRDVDTAADAQHVAEIARGLRFTSAVHRHVPATVAA